MIAINKVLRQNDHNTTMSSLIKQGVKDPRGGHQKGENVKEEPKAASTSINLVIF